MKEIESYINSIDFSLITDDTALSNVYEEIGDCGSQLARSPFAATNLERLVLMTGADLLVPFLKSLGAKTVYKKLGSRIVESIYRRLFECMYVRGEYFRLEEAVGAIDCGACLGSRDATHVLRQVIMLVSGKRVDGLNVEKYQIIDSGRGEAVAAAVPNSEYSKKLLSEYKAVFMEAVQDMAIDDSYITLLVFLQCTRSQSLLSRFVTKDCEPCNIKKRGYVYEAIPPIANKPNLSLIFDRVGKNIMDLSLNEQSSYFMASFIRFYNEPTRVYKRLVFSRFEKNSSIVLSLLEALQRNKDYQEVAVLVKSFYEMGESLFAGMLLGRDEGLDTKYVGAVVNFMGMPAKHNFRVNEDFIRLFSQGWLSCRAGKRLVAGFAAGSSPSKTKADFFNKNIDLFWDCIKWKKEGRTFIKNVTEYTTGHPRKKAFEILHRFSIREPRE